MAGADAIGQRLLADPVDEIVGVILADQRQHHVERGGAAGAGEDVVVDLEKVGMHVRLRKCLGKARQVLPVDGAAPLGQKPGAGENPGTSAQAANGDAALVRFSQVGEAGAVVEILDEDAGADEDHRRLAFPISARRSVSTDPPTVISTLLEAKTGAPEGEARRQR